MRYLVSEKISTHRSIDNSGYLVCTDAILSRTGKQDYSKSEIVADSTGEDGNTQVHVDRPADEVFSEQALASFENKPITVEHPDEDVNPENYKDYSVGFVRDVHKGVDPESGKDVMMGSLVVTDKDAIDEIENGDYKFLSCGYDCDFVGDGTNLVQRHIRGNHVALCKVPRAGITRIQDSMDSIKGYYFTTNYNNNITNKLKKYLDDYIIPFKNYKDGLMIYGTSEDRCNNIKHILESDFNAKCTEPTPIMTTDSQYGIPIERNTVTIRRGYHNLSAAADKFKTVYMLAMKETSMININLITNTLEAMYIDAYNDSKQAYQKDIADTAVDHYSKALQLANDFKIKRKEQLSVEQLKLIEKYISQIQKLEEEIEVNSVPSTFKKDILESLDRYNDPAPTSSDVDENSIDFDKNANVVKPEVKVEEKTDVSKDPKTEHTDEDTKSKDEDTTEDSIKDATNDVKAVAMKIYNYLKGWGDYDVKMISPSEVAYKSYQSNNDAGSMVVNNDLTITTYDNHRRRTGSWDNVQQYLEAEKYYDNPYNNVKQDDAKDCDDTRVEDEDKSITEVNVIADSDEEKDMIMNALRHHIKHA